MLRFIYFLQARYLPEALLFKEVLSERFLPERGREKKRLVSVQPHSCLSGCRAAPGHRGRDALSIPWVSALIQARCTPLQKDSWEKHAPPSFLTCCLWEKHCELLLLLPPSPRASSIRSAMRPADAPPHQSPPAAACCRQAVRFWAGIAALFHFHWRMLKTCIQALCRGCALLRAQGTACLCEA